MTSSRGRHQLAAFTASCIVIGVVHSPAGETPEKPASVTANHGDLCRHGIERGRCPFCTPALVESEGFCREHGVPEALCTRCRPSLKRAFQLENDWCERHSAPESQCSICHPSKVKAATREAPKAAAPNPPATTASRNGAARRAAQPPSPTCANSAKPVRLQYADVVRTAGLQFAELQEQPLLATINRNAELTYNANRYARLSPRAAGVIIEVGRDLGEVVVAGDALAVVDSVELGSAKAEYLHALAGVQSRRQTAERQRSMAGRGIGAESEALEAESKLVEAQISQAKAKQCLRNLGLSDPGIASLEQSQDTSSHLRLTTPFDGVVVERSAVLGEVVDTQKVLFAVAHTQTMWAMIDLFEADASVVSVGQEVVFSLESVPGHAFAGGITWISTRLDPTTRTLKARAEIANAHGLLRANAFGRAQITVRRVERALIVPKDAVQWDGCCNIVFVKSNEDGTIFQPTQVRLGVDTGIGYEVLSGVKSGDILVTAGSYLLKTEILKGSIGAGCCDHVEKLDR